MRIKKFDIYFGSLGLLAAATLAYAGQDRFIGLFDPKRPMALTLLVLAVGSYVFRCWQIDSFAEKSSSFRLSSLTNTLIVFLYGPFFGAVAAATNALLSKFFYEKRSAKIAVYNFFQFIVVYGGAGLVYYGLLVKQSTTGMVAVDYLDLIRGKGVFEYISAGLVPFTLTVYTIFLLNTLLVSMAIGFAKGRPILRSWRMNESWKVLQVTAAVPFYLLLFATYSRFEVVGLIIILILFYFFYHNYGLYLEQKRSTREMTSTLVSCIEANDRYTAGHSQRVAAMCLRLGKASGLSERKLEDLEIAAFLHDLGKNDMQFREILAKPSRLTPAEIDLMKEHAPLGARLIGKITSRSFQRVARIIRHHHECFDGSGHPDGLAGDKIPKEARVITICDALDAMTSDRPYRKALSQDVAVGELLRCRGKQFDPALVAILVTEVLGLSLPEDENDPYDGPLSMPAPSGGGTPSAS